MSTGRPRYGKEEVARKGREFYQQQILPRVEAGNQGRIVAIDVETGDFELADDVLNASKRLLARRPDAQIWCERVGEPAVHRIGWSPWRPK